jgi:hypothetical protein
VTPISKSEQFGRYEANQERKQSVHVSARFHMGNSGGGPYPSVSVCDGRFAVRVALQGRELRVPGGFSRSRVPAALRRALPDDVWSSALSLMCSTLGDVRSYSPDAKMALLRALRQRAPQLEVKYSAWRDEGAQGAQLEHRLRLSGLADPKLQRAWPLLEGQDADQGVDQSADDGQNRASRSWGHTDSRRCASVVPLAVAVAPGEEGASRERVAVATAESTTVPLAVPVLDDSDSELDQPW